jgi:hypothetical protein
MYAVIDDELNKQYLEIYQSDIKDILNEKLTDKEKIEEIKEYLKL